MPNKNYRRLSTNGAFISFALLQFLFPVYLTAQSTLSGKQHTVVAHWKLDATNGGVEFYHSIVECGGKKVVFLKFKNNNSNSVKVYWREIFFTQQSGSTAEGPFREKDLILLPGETAESDCENIKQAELVTRPDQITPVYQAKVLKFSFRDIRVAKSY